MPVDRDATLKKAETLLKQGKLAAAIEEYVRLAEDRPNDWNLSNTLGDLYVKAGDSARAANQFVGVADHLFAEGFFPRAAAVYKKVLKVQGDHDYAIWQLADIAGRQGLGLDARSYYARLIKDRRAAGNERGAEDCLVRLGQLGDADVDARTVAARLLVERGESRKAAAVMLAAADLLTRDGRLPEALDALRQAATLDPDNVEIREKLAAAAPAATDVASAEDPSAVLVDTEVASAEDPAAVLAGIVASPDPVPEDPLPLDSLFEELEASVTRNPDERAEAQDERLAPTVGEEGPDGRPPAGSEG